MSLVIVIPPDKGISLRRPLAGRKALDTSFYRSIDEVFLDRACWIFLFGNERE